MAGAEEKNLHLVLDQIVSRLKVDVGAAEKKHNDAVKAFEKEAKEAKEAEQAVEQQMTCFNLGTLDVAKTALDTAAGAAKKATEEAEAAKALSDDVSWKTDVQDLQNSIQAISTLREAVEKLSDQYVHGTTSTSTTT